MFARYTISLVLAATLAGCGTVDVVSSPLAWAPSARPMTDGHPELEATPVAASGPIAAAP